MHEVAAPTAKDLFSTVVRWSNDRRRLVDTEALAVVVLTAQSIAPVRWTPAEARRFVTVEIPRWCAAEGVEMPANAAGSVMTFVEFLADRGALTVREGAVAAVREALVPFIRRWVPATADVSNVVPIRSGVELRPLEPTRARARRR
ncbi:MAG: hypothetical protein AB7L13_21525 [Acidimicrobiia bacterium]